MRRIAARVYSTPPRAHVKMDELKDGLMSREEFRHLFESSGVVPRIYDSLMYRVLQLHTFFPERRLLNFQMDLIARNEKGTIEILPTVNESGKDSGDSLSEGTHTYVAHSRL